MRADRRTFMKIAGLTVVGLSLRPTVDALAGGEQVESANQTAPTGALTAKRWAMVVDETKCWKDSGCTDCIEACRKAHNIPTFDDPKSEIKWIWTEQFEEVFPEQAQRLVATASLAGKPVTLLCNHCQNPPCVKVCPTQATFQRADGIVMMDEHRCIGCRYCMVACPFGARSFNFRDPRTGLDLSKANPDFPTRTRGVVEKCNFCVERLAKGQMPACVDACEEKALVFGDVEDRNSEVRKLLEARLSLVRRPELGTEPQVYYIVS